MRESAEATLKLRLVAAEMALAHALELIEDLNGQVTAANEAAVRMAQRMMVMRGERSGGRRRAA